MLHVCCTCVATPCRTAERRGFDHPLLLRQKEEEDLAPRCCSGKKRKRIWRPAAARAERRGCDHPLLSARKRACPDASSGPARKKPRDWSVSEVISYLEGLGLGHVQDGFKENAVDGRTLTEMTAEELVQYLGLTKLQARKVVSRLE